MRVMALGLESKGLGWAMEFTYFLGPQFPWSCKVLDGLWNSHISLVLNFLIRGMV